ncbi:MBL fold metallo-hydrolase [Sandaracinobacter neustonicus]|uniref:MBL fold metallo-hydrolase n=1 Tax=Sandaracinobacter neustonicus TaxID=1715348 RepID=A0A501XI59_9SPHN|nr:alkyl sulfatase dimerization domain-containing protein [Sandaracinobacter neustonicus]TPE60165.1 MBL fold metallo-hydrolase [Sandaracinobacter neustonicus]
MKRGWMGLMVAASLLHGGPGAAQAVSASTRAANAAMAASLPADDGQDADFAARGFLGTWPSPTIPRDDGKGIAWDFAALDRLKGPAPASVNPSLWRHSLLLAKHGLFRVSDRVWQVRGFDLSVMTIIRGDTGYILVDPLLSAETARAALQLVRQKLGDRPVTGLIYTHSHSDHFGGAAGVITEAEAKAIPILAPEGFLEHAVAENVIAGNAMGRRAVFQFGATLPFAPDGRVTAGIGPAASGGSIGLIPPNESVKATGDTRRIDGVQFEFQLTPDTEAPAEMNFYLPQFRILHLAENANPTMHNILTPRGALVRDSKAWADQLTVALRLWGGKSDILVTSHGWPRFGQPVVADFIASHRDAYKYLHDQSVRLMNMGLTKDEIAEAIDLPPALKARWFNRGYYGTMNHNSKAVYQRYLGWYSGNPADLNPYPPEALGKHYVEALGGPDRVIALAKVAVAQGDYRWAATLLDHLVFSGASTPEAKALLADSYRQMAYAAEGSLWRNMYLTAATELENGPRAVSTGATGIARLIPTTMLLDLMAVRLVPERAPATPFTVALVLPDVAERHFITIRNGVMIHESDVADTADVTVTMPRATFLRAIAGAGASGPPPQIEGRADLLPVFLGLFEAPPTDFPIVTP